MYWKEIKCKGINSIEKLTAEFDISAFDLIGDLFNDGEFIPYAEFKVRVYEIQDNNIVYCINGRCSRSAEIMIRSRYPCGLSVLLMCLPFYL